jgi:hypothetical protein
VASDRPLEVACDLETEAAAYRAGEGDTLVGGRVPSGEQRPHVDGLAVGGSVPRRLRIRITWSRG